MLANSDHGADILQLPTLKEGGTLTQEQITTEVARKHDLVRGEIYTLVVTGKLTRFCGVGNSPAIYCLPCFRNQYA